MPTTATLSRGTTSISLPIEDESGTPLVSRDFGKPTVELLDNGKIDPRVKQDNWAGMENHTINTQLLESDAYQKAIDLADLIKSHSRGDDLTIDYPFSEFDSNISVYPAAEQEQALTLTYEPGRTNWVGVELMLTRISSIRGGDGGQKANTPTTPGSGPVEITDGNTTVELGKDLVVSRSVGRPNSDVRGQTLAQYPRVTDQRKSAFDQFELEFHLTENTTTKISNIIDFFQTRQFRNTYTLKFNGQYKLGDFTVFPAGSQAFRHTRTAGHVGGEEQPVPTLNLRVVN